MASDFSLRHFEVFRIKPDFDHPCDLTGVGRNLAETVAVHGAFVDDLGKLDVQLPEGLIDQIFKAVSFLCLFAGVSEFLLPAPSDVRLLDGAVDREMYSLPSKSFQESPDCPIGPVSFEVSSRHVADLFVEDLREEVGSHGLVCNGSAPGHLFSPKEGVCLGPIPIYHSIYAMSSRVVLPNNIYRHIKVYSKIVARYENSNSPRRRQLHNL